MMCEHEFESLRTADGSFCMTACRKCMKSTGEIETLAKDEAFLAAANARVAELEKERNNYLSFGQGGASFTDSQWLDKLATAEHRAEQANARVEELEEFKSDVLSNIGGATTAEHVTEHLTKLRTVIFDERKAKEQAEAQNKRMQTAINRYVIGNIDLLDALKAALEEKP